MDRIAATAGLPSSTATALRGVLAELAAGGGGGNKYTASGIVIPPGTQDENGGYVRYLTLLDVPLEPTAGIRSWLAALELAEPMDSNHVSCQLDAEFAPVVGTPTMFVFTLTSHTFDSVTGGTVTFSAGSTSTPPINVTGDNPRQPGNMPPNTGRPTDPGFAAMLQAAIEALPEVGAGHVTVTDLSDGSQAGQWQIDFDSAIELTLDATGKTPDTDTFLETTRPFRRTSVGDSGGSSVYPQDGSTVAALTGPNGWASNTYVPSVVFAQKAQNLNQHSPELRGPPLFVNPPPARFQIVLSVWTDAITELVITKLRAMLELV